MQTQADRCPKSPASVSPAGSRRPDARKARGVNRRATRGAAVIAATIVTQSLWSPATFAQFTFSGYSDATFGVPSPNIPNRTYDINYVDALGRPRRDTGIEIGDPSGASSNYRYWRFSNATRQHGNLYELNSAAFNSVGVNAPFPIADLSYFNAETFTAGASVYNVPITTRLNLTSLIGAPTPQFDFNFRLTFTENTFGPVPDTLEFLNASSAQTFTYGNTTYALRLRGFSNDNGTTLQNTFSLPEYATVTSRLYGQLEVVEGPRLFVNYPGQMIFQARVGTTASQQLTVQNSGASNTSLVGYVQGVAGTSKFGPSDSLDFTLASGESVTRTYTYRPTSRTQGLNDYQTINVVSNASNGIEDVVLVGQGVGPVYFSSPAPNSTINMGRVMADAGSASIPISNVTNDGALGALTYLTLRGMTFSGTNGSEFRAWDIAPGTHIGPGDPARTMRVRLVSGQRGVKSARLTVDTDVNAAYEADGTDYNYNVTATAVEKRRINVEAIDYGRVMRGSAPTKSVRIAGDATPDNFYTNPTLLPVGGTDGTINVSGDTQERPVNSSSGAVLSTRTVTANFPNAGLQDGFVPLQVRPEGLAGEGNYDVGVAWQATAVDDRTITGTAVSFGKIFVNTPAAARPATLTTEGEDDLFTRVTVKAGQFNGGDGTRIEVAEDVVFDNPSATAQANISANFSTPGVRTAAPSQLNVANGGVVGEGLAGESVKPVTVAYDAQVYSRGRPSFSPTSDQQSLTLNVGRMIAGGSPAAGTASFSLHNRATSDTTAAIEFDGVSTATGNTGQFTTGLPASFAGLEAGTSNTYTASLQAGATGQVSATYVLAFHDQRDVEGHADNDSLTLTLTASAVANRVITADAVSVGKVFAATPVSKSTTLRTTGDDAAFTRVTLNGGTYSAAPASVQVPAATTVFNSTSSTATALLSATFATPGSVGGNVQLNAANGALAGEGLAGESVQPVDVAYTADVYSRGKPSFSATVDQQSLTLNVGRMIVGGSPAAGSASFSIHNRVTSAKTAALEFDGVSASAGDTGRFNTGLPSSFSGLQAGSPNVYTASLQAGASGLVNATYVLAFHDQRDVQGHANNDPLTLTLAANAVANRVITADPVNVGRVFAASPVSKTTTLRTTGDDSAFTRVTLNGGTYTAAPASVQVPAATTVFNSGSSTATAVVNASFAAPGAVNGGVPLTAANGALVGEGLAGEAVQPVSVGYTAQVFSRGRPSFNGSSFSNALSFDFGQYNLGSAATPFSFNLHNLLTAGGANFTGGIEVESISSAGDNTRFTLTTPALGSLVSPGSPRSANASLSTAVPGTFSATYTIRFYDDRTIAGAAQSTDQLTLTLTGKVVNPITPTPTRTNIFVVNPGFEQVWPDPTSPTNITLDPGRQTLGFGATFAPAGTNGTLLPRFVPGWNSADELDDKSGVHRPTVTGPNAAFVAGGFVGQNVAYTDGDPFEQTVIGTFDPNETYELRFKVGRRDSGQFYPPDVSLLLGTSVFAPLSTNFPVPPAGGFADWTATYRIAAGDPLFGAPLTIRVTPDARSRIGFDSFAIVIPATGPEGPYDTEWGWSSGGEWSELPKWTYGIPNYAGSEAWFYDAITNPSTVTLDSDITVGAVRFDNAKRYTLSGPNKLRLDNAGAGPAELEVKAGAHVIAGPIEMLTATQAIVANGGTLTISGAINNPSGYGITKSGLGTLVLSGTQTNGPGATVSVTGGTLSLKTALGATTSLSVAGTGSSASIEVNQRLLSIALMTTGQAVLVGDGRTLTVSQSYFNGGTLDVARGYAVFDYASSETSPLASLVAAINSGRAGGTWTGTGIVSALARTSGGAVSVAAVEASRLAVTNAALYANLNLDQTAVVVRVALMGDANLDGVVNFVDLLTLASNYNQSLPAGWGAADYNTDGVVNFVDLLSLAANYNQSLPAAGGVEFAGDWALAGAVPEPASLLLASTVPAIALRRLRRRTR
jgi:hypothetical protein